MKNLKTKAVIFLIALLCLSLPGLTNSAPDTGSESDLKLRQQLWSLVRSLNKLRTDHYEKHNAATEKITELKDVSAQLQAQLDQLNQQNLELDKALSESQTQIDKLNKQKQSAETIESVAGKTLSSFITAQSSQIESSIPYQKTERLTRLTEAKQAAQLSEMLAATWNYSQQELRIAQTGETYTSQVKLDSSRTRHARIFRVGHFIMGFVTEEDGQVGIWNPKTGWTSPGNPDSVKQAIDILDKKQTPKYIQLPVYTEIKKPDNNNK